MVDAIERSKMKYQECVDAAAAALKRGDDANWELARLTFENTKAGSGTRTLDEWSTDVRVKSGRRFAKATASRYAKMHRTFTKVNPRPSWTEAWQSQYDDSNGGKRVSPKKVVKDIESWQPETKKAAIEKLAADDLETAVKTVGATAEKAVKRLSKEMEAADEHDDPQPKRRKQRRDESAKAAFLMNLMSGVLSLEKAAGQVHEAVPADFTTEDQKAVQDGYERATVALAVVEMAVTTIEEIIG